MHKSNINYTPLIFQHQSYDKEKSKKRTLNLRVFQIIKKLIYIDGNTKSCNVITNYNYKYIFKKKK